MKRQNTCTLLQHASVQTNCHLSCAQARRSGHLSLDRAVFPALRKLWAPAQYKRRLQSWDSSLVRVIFTHWKQRIQRHLARKRACAKNAEAWLRRAMAIYLAREQREALTRYHTCRQGRHPCPLEHVAGASGVKFN